VNLLAAMAWQPLIERGTDERVPKAISAAAFLQQPQFQSAIKSVEQKSVGHGRHQLTYANTEIA
jgi:hypothetical protein